MEAERDQIQRFLAGDQQAFTGLVEAYQRPVYNLAYRMLGNAEEAEDAAQETFLRVYQRITTYDPSRKFSSWILSIASHHCIDRLRRRRFTWVSLDEVLPWKWFPGQQVDPEKELDEQEQRDEMQSLLRKLPPHYRLVLVLRYWHEMSYEEICDITGNTVSAVKSRLHRARLMLGEQMTGQWTDGETVHSRKERVMENALP